MLRELRRKCDMIGDTSIPRFYPLVRVPNVVYMILGIQLGTLKSVQGIGVQVD